MHSVRVQMDYEIQRVRSERGKTSNMLPLGMQWLYSCTEVTHIHRTSVYVTCVYLLSAYKIWCSKMG